MPRYSGQWIIAHRLAAELAGRGLANENAAGRLGALDRRRVDGGDIVCHGAGPGRVGHTGNRHEVFCRERDAMQRAQRPPLHDGLLRRFGRAERRFRQQDEKRVQGFLRRLGFCQRPLGQLDRRYILADNAAAQLHRRRIVKLVGVRTRHGGLTTDKSATLVRSVS